MVKQIFLEEYNKGRMTSENRQLEAEFKRRGLPIQYFTKKQLFRGRLSVSRETLVAGEIPVVENALGQIGIQFSRIDSYPECLHELLKRRIWKSDLSRVLSDLESGIINDVFVKPSDRAKKFTGFVINSHSDLYGLGGISRKTPVYCSEVVDWISEFRVYIINSSVAGIRNYSGDPEIEIDESIVKKALFILEELNVAPAGYAIDFGVLKNGETALVEMNDGYSLGSYNLEDDKYADLLLARWEELMSYIE